MSIKPNRNGMRAAIQMAEKNNDPIGVTLAMGDQVVATASSQINSIDDADSHAVVKVLRQLSDQTNKKDFSGFTLYSTCVPCRDCFKAVVDSGIKTVVYGCEFSEMNKYSIALKSTYEDDATEYWNDVDRIEGFLKEECEMLLRKFGG